LVEQRIRNAKVVGSTPISGTIHKKGSLLAALFCIYSGNSSTVNKRLYSRIAYRSVIPAI
jgi:hypothetical protein